MTACLGADITLAGVIGDKPAGRKVLDLLDTRDTEPFLWADTTRPTTADLPLTTTRPTTTAAGSLNNQTAALYGRACHLPAFLGTVPTAVGTLLAMFGIVLLALGAAGLADLGAKPAQVLREPRLMKAAASQHMVAQSRSRRMHSATHSTFRHLCSEGDSAHREKYAKAHEYAMDCAAFCRLAASLMAHHSPLARYSHQACADACRACAEVCAAVPNDELLKQCAEHCRKCA